MRPTPSASLLLALFAGLSCDAPTEAPQSTESPSRTGASVESAHASEDQAAPEAAEVPFQATPAPAAEQPPTPAVDRAARIAALAALAKPADPNAVFSLLPRNTDAWRALLRNLPELATYADAFTPFSARDADAALVRGKRSRSTITIWTIADAPFVWRPGGERELWVTSGTSGPQSLVAVLERKGDDVQHAASTVLAEKDTSVALAYDAARPRELLWTTCYGCPGQGGSIVLGDDGRPRFVYR